MRCCRILEIFVTKMSTFILKAYSWTIDQPHFNYMFTNTFFLQLFPLYEPINYVKTNVLFSIMLMTCIAKLFDRRDYFVLHSNTINLHDIS